MTTQTQPTKQKVHKRMLPFGWFVFVLVLAFGCSTSKNYKILTFFFDGVPKIPEEVSALTNDTLVQPGDTLILANSIATPAVSQIMPHQPYHDRQCGSCHDQSTMGKLNKPLPGLCYQCHEDFGTKYKTIHGPISGGQCNMCHSPHMSANPLLLTRTGQQLCLYCHSDAALWDKGKHAEAKDTDCTVCHNPHGGNDNNLLR